MVAFGVLGIAGLIAAAVAIVPSGSDDRSPLAVQAAASETDQPTTTTDLGAPATSGSSTTAGSSSSSGGSAPTSIGGKAATVAATQDPTPTTQVPAPPVQTTLAPSTPFVPSHPEVTAPPAPPWSCSVSTPTVQGSSLTANVTMSGQGQMIAYPSLLDTTAPGEAPRVKTLNVVAGVPVAFTWTGLEAGHTYSVSVFQTSPESTSSSPVCSAQAAT